MSVGVVSIVGIPPTNGFICKWLIAVGAMQARKPLFAAALLFGALLIFAYYIRILNAAYFREPREEYRKMDEAPRSMLVPVVILAVACLVFGFGASVPLRFIRPAAQSLLSTAIK